MRAVLSCILLLYSVEAIVAQELYIQLEEINSVKLIRYYPGQKITFKTLDYNKSWRKDRIVSVLPDDNLVEFYHLGYVPLTDITDISRSNTGAKVMAGILGTFGLTWLMQGSLATIGDSGFKMSKDEVIIGVVPIAVAWLINKFFGRRKYKIGKLYRLRIMDVRWTIP